MKTVHDTRQQARRELGDAGYLVAFSSPGRPELWINNKSRKAIARKVVGADESWVILPYPEPATCGPLQAVELAKRDGIVLQAGVLPNDTEPTSPPLDSSSVDADGADAKSASDGAVPEQPESAPSAATSINVNDIEL